MLADLGIDFSPLNHILKDSGFPASISVSLEKKAGFMGSSAEVNVLQYKGEKRNIRDIEKIIDRFHLSPFVKDRSKRAFKRLAQIEASCHGIGEEEVHFHELGAIDTIVDIVGAFWGIEKLNVERVLCSHLPWFEGEVLCAHGVLPLPAPATLHLLQNKPLYPTSITDEIITPTGALVLDEIVDEFSTGFKGYIKKSGIGWGKREIKGVSFNGIRGILFYPHISYREEEIILLETNIDHLSGEEIGDLFDIFLNKKALDVIYIPAVMKKNRPGGILKILCYSQHKDIIVREVFKFTHTLGIRVLPITRYVAERNTKKVLTEIGEIEVKEYSIEGEKYFRIEYESLKKISRKKGISLDRARELIMGYINSGTRK